MSNAVSINVTCMMASMKLMMEGLTELGEALSIEDVRHKANAEASVENCAGEKVKVDYVLKNKTGDRIGLRANPKTNAVEFVAKDLEKASVKESVSAALQAYSRIKILNEVKSKGYGKVKEEKLPNGSIRLVVEKWR